MSPEAAQGRNGSPARGLATSRQGTSSTESLFPCGTRAPGPEQGLPGRAGMSRPGVPKPAFTRVPRLPTEEIDVDVESTDYLPGDLDWSSSVSDSDERGSTQSLGSDEGYSSSSRKRIRLQDNHKTCLGL